VSGERSRFVLFCLTPCGVEVEARVLALVSSPSCPRPRVLALVSFLFQNAEKKAMTNAFIDGYKKSRDKIKRGSWE